VSYGNVQVAQEAQPPSGPSSPQISKNTLLGGVLGLLIGLGLAFVLERLDRRIRSPEDLEEIYHLPMLGVVPESTRLSHTGRRKARAGVPLPPAEAEAFNLIRAHLRFFNIDHDLRTVVIASASPGDGKSTVARYLSEAAARLGSKVLLLEADLRQPTLAKQLDLQPLPGPTDVLIGSDSIERAVQPVELEGAAPSDGALARRTLDVLVSGPTPPNPGELLESQAMVAVLEHAKSVYDLVIIDTPPLTAVSDALPLLAKVDGVVLVGWVARSRRDAAERLHQVLASSGAQVLGIVANGAKSAMASPYPGKMIPALPSSNGSTSEQTLNPTVTS
jgi:capsular exopolysaccharide synthesis family protein